MSTDAPTARDVAARVVLRVVRERAYSHLALDAELNASALQGRDRALATELAYGTLTWHLQLLQVAGRLIPNLDRVQPEVLAIVEVGLYQLGHLDRVPSHAAVSEAVESTRRLGRRFRAAVGFVNGVLRAASRQPQLWPAPRPLAEDPEGHIAARGALPRWLAARLRVGRDDADAAALAASLVERPRLTLRRLPGAPELPATEGATPGRWAPCALDVPRMSRAVREAIAQGEATVQDEGAQLVGLLADPPAGARILDACAGLGGKTAHLALLAGPEASITAVDPNASKLELLRQTFERLKLPAPRTLATTLQAADPAALGGPFDVILIDAPCTGLGVLRRHPETRWHRSPEDVATLASLQRALLAAALPLLAPGGRLIYSVCTFTAEEGPEAIAWLRAAHPELRLVLQGAAGVPWDALEPGPQGFSLLPHRHQTDGFFLARLDCP